MTLSFLWQSSASRMHWWIDYYDGGIESIIRFKSDYANLTSFDSMTFLILALLILIRLPFNIDDGTDVGSCF